MEGCLRLSTLPPPKVKDFSLSPEFTTEFGFVKATAVNGYLTLRHKSGGALRCEFDHRNLPKSKKRLENAIAANENDIKFDSSFDSRKFVIRFIDILVQDAEQEYAQHEAAHQVDQIEKQKILDEISKDKATREISMEDWEETRKEKFAILRKTVKKNLSSIWLPLEFALSIKCVINISKNTLPFAGIVLGAPSTLKTASLIMLSKWPQTFYTDHFTSRSLVSHNTAVPREDLTEIDMLPRWRGN